MSVAELLRYLKCLRCGTRENLTFYTYSKNYKYKTGGAPFYTVHKGTNSLKTPICHDCLHKIKRWKLSLYLTVGLLILVEVIFGLLTNFLGLYMLNFIGLAVYLGLIFANIIIFLLANINNPKRYVKFRGHVPYVRPIKSNKWIPFKEWAEIVVEGNSIQPLIQEPINPLVWKFPLIGGIVCLISILTPTQIVVYNNGIVLYWMSLLALYSNISSLVFFFHPILITSPTTLFSTIIIYIAVLGAAFVIINKAYLLKRAEHSITSINNMHLAFGVILIILISVFLINFNVNSMSEFWSLFIPFGSTTQILSSGAYGVYAGGVFTLLGPIIQHIKKLR
jgi:hypothetical protein